jgi:hypothetical protein
MSYQVQNTENLPVLRSDQIPVTNLSYLDGVLWAVYQVLHTMRNTVHHITNGERVILRVIITITLY